jgi:NAD(P)-dependent dehydrogenase (short-subunit alcohol dehydrogenase family)
MPITRYALPSVGATAMNQSAEVPLPALRPGGVAFITGAASGIGLAAATRLAAMGLKIAMADRESSMLDRAAESVGALAAGGDASVLEIVCDVARPEDMQRAADAVFGKFGKVSMLMNNAGIGSNPGQPWENIDGWRLLVDVNFWGVVNGVQAFLPRMLEQGSPAIVVNTGSKQGITTPPGNLAYNVSKAALRTYTEGLAHALRNTASEITAHLLIPGFTFTGLTTGAREKPPGAWMPAEVVDFMLTGLSRGDFYILCPDNETTRQDDERRMAWSIGDIIENRPALSRWHPDYRERFDGFFRR